MKFSDTWEQGKEMKIFTLQNHVVLDEKRHDLKVLRQISRETYTVLHSFVRRSFIRLRSNSQFLFNTVVIMSEENHMGWKLVSGVRQDVINLFKMFADTNSVRFEDFCKVWKEMKFSHIFNNRIAIVELLEFTEELFQIIKEYVSAVYEFHTRVAALYALYGLYFKQPIRGAAKIRFTKTEWQDLVNLIEMSKSGKHYDIAFIYCKMYLNGAFTFAATVRTAGLERGFRKYSEKKNSLVSKSCDVELMYRPLVSERLVNSLVKLESLYCRKKSELLGKKNLVFIDGKFAESLQEELKNYASAIQSKSTIRNKSLTNDESNSISESQSGSVSSTKKGKTSKHKSSETKKNSKSGEDKEMPSKRKKFGKIYLELLAKKKAEFYLKKLKNTDQGQAENKMKLEELLQLNVSDSEDNT